MTELKVKIKRLENSDNIPLPSYQTEGSACMDVHAAIHRPLELYSRTCKLIPTGISVALPEGYEMQVRPRSGMAIKNSVNVANAPGTIDSDYRGELKVLLFNNGENTFIVEPGMRIAQIIVAPVLRWQWEEVEELDDTVRGEGGFGSTGGV